jgi:hypothetical protein
LNQIGVSGKWWSLIIELLGHKNISSSNRLCTCG